MDRRSRLSAALAFAVAAALMPPLYVASCGPVVRLGAEGVILPEAGWGFQAPAQRAFAGTPAERPFVDYVAWWLGPPILR